RHQLRLPRRTPERLLQQLRRIFLYEDPRLEVEPRREPEVFVRGAGVTVDASVLAPTVRIQAVGEGDVRAVVTGQRRPGRVAEEQRRHLAERIVVERRRVLDHVEAIETRGGVRSRSAPPTGWHVRKLFHPGIHLVQTPCSNEIAPATILPSRTSDKLTNFILNSELSARGGVLFSINKNGCRGICLQRFVRSGYGPPFRC